MLEFKDTFKQITQLYNDDISKFELTCSILKLNNKLIINLYKNGQIDICYDLQLNKINKSQIIYNDYDDDDNDTEYDDLTSNLIPIVLIGNSNNMKTQVLASQIGKLINEKNISNYNDNIILHSSGQFFNNDDNDDNNDNNDDDFNKLQFIISTFNKCIT
ncbi:hypothetical protein CANARDRAFT_126621 [[Candida] arabinofermentans NRRL YB-2248]|uniref:Proteasome assembly chaperone 3 n=1 Tax=[Candida] arabinofermentans NRRL YB-2248 TaxID=983967 RepID=A0A1E4SSZ8_9ASCO|nr:hypothetical protein CANARDRAFT_126621 [[Candida] arabinofermentans NRRL YB-2248]